MSEEENWRSDTAYEYVDKLTANDLAWEFLRRNPEYRTAFQALVSSGRLTDEAAKIFARQWGLCFRGRPAHHGAWTADLLDPTSKSRNDHPTTAAGIFRRIPYPR